MVRVVDVPVEYIGPYHARVEIFDGGLHVFDIRIVKARGGGKGHVLVVDEEIPPGGRSPVNEQFSIYHELVRRAAGRHFAERARIIREEKKKRDKREGKRFPA